MMRKSGIFLLFAAAMFTSSAVRADSTVASLPTLTTSPIPALSCLYVDQGPGIDTKLCAGSPLSDTLAHAFGSLSQSDNLSDLQNAATARTNLGLAAVAASGSAADLTGTLPAASLPPTGVSPGNCTNCNLTIGADGRITVQGNGSGGIAGPGPTTNGFVPVWNGTGGNALGTGLAVGSGANSLVETDGSGLIPAAALPLPGVSTVGGVKNFTPIAHNFLTGLAANGSLSAAQPACGDLSDAQSGCSTALGTMATQPSSNVSITGGTITVSADPTAALQVATKEYVDNTAAQISRLSPVAAATAAPLPNSPVYNNGTSGVGATLTASVNGALVADGYTPVVGDRLLVQFEATAANNGLYQVTATGDTGDPFVLTRSTDFDMASEIVTGATVFARNGTVNLDTQFTMNTPQPITVGTTAINWVQTGAGGGVGGPASSTVGFVPQWGNVGGSTLTPGLAVGVSGNNVLVETNGSGLLSNSIIPSPGAAPSLGGIESFTAPAHEFLTGISTGGVPAAAALALGDLPAIGSNTVLGNVTGGSAAPTALSKAQLTALCNIATTSLPGCAPSSPGGTTAFLRADLTWAIPPGSSGTWVPPATIDATAQSGSDLCAKISNAQNILAASNGSHGGIIYALSFTSPSHCSNSPFSGWTSDRNYVLVLGPGIIQTDQSVVVPTWDSLIGTTQYPNFGSSAGSIIQVSNSYGGTAGVQHAVTGSSGSTTLSLSSTSGITLGDAVTGPNIAPYALVASITPNTSVTVTEPNTGTVSTTATFMPAVVSMGQAGQNDFHIHIENIAATCQPPSGSMPPGCIVFQDLWAQEGSYFRNTYAGLGQIQYDLEDTGSVNPQNISPWIDLFAQQLVSTGGLDLAHALCLRVGNSTNLLPVGSTIDKLSCAGTSGTTAELALVDAASLTIKDSHFENANNAILVGSKRNSHGITLEDITCGTGIVTTCAEFSAAGGSNGDTVLGLSDSVSTNMVKDDQAGGCTITGTSAGSPFAGITYIRGGNGSTPVLKGLYGGC